MALRFPTERRTLAAQTPRPTSIGKRGEQLKL
jgi:hypothetical protein